MAAVQGTLIKRLYKEVGAIDLVVLKLSSTPNF